MKMYASTAARLMTAVALMLSLIPVMAANVDVGINSGIPGAYVPEPVYVQPQTVYVQPQPVYVEREDEYWKCKKDKCKLKTYKNDKRHKEDEPY
jgi:hypothetical protein